MTEINAKIIADSINPDDNRVTTFLLVYPRYIHSEIMTHRAFSRNAASSRAIPISKIIDQVYMDRAMPISWGKNQKGMQASLSYTEREQIRECEEAWIHAANSAIESAKLLQNIGLHKQIVNRVLEPFTWMTTLVTATEWENFYSLRLHKDAQPEFQRLAYVMLKTYLSSQPEYKKWGEWHIPFCDNDIDLETSLKIATARAARTSYVSFDKDHSIKDDIELHDKLMESGHWSPFEHACQADKYDSSGNLYGWKQYRHFFKDENRRCDLKLLLKQYEEYDANA